MSKSPTKVFFFIPGFAGGGAEKQCIYLVNALSKRDDLEIGLVHFHEGINYRLIDDEVALFPLPTRSNYDPRNVWRAHRLFQREKPDVVFSWLHATDSYAWAARTIGRGFKWIMAERNSWYEPDPRFWIRNLVGRYADMVVSNSEKGDLYWKARGVSEDRRRVIANVLPDGWFAPRREGTPEPVVCYAGRLEAQKCVTKLVDSFVALSRRRSDVRFIIAGEGSLRPEVEARARLASEGTISVLPFQADIRPLYERSSVFVNVSKHEGLPNTVIENLALGTRVVLSRIPEHVALVGENYPFLVDLDESEEGLATVIGRALETQVSDEELRGVWKRLEPMRMERIAAEYSSLFLEVARRPRSFLRA